MDSEYARPTVDTEPPPGVLRRAIAASAIGNATEWFDYGIYAYGVTYISAAIFPGDTASATLLALMTFAVSFLVRSAGRTRLGPARGPPRPQTGARGHHPADVRRHPVRRPGPELRNDRLLGASAAGALADGPGLFHWRGVRRRRDIHGRICAMPQARFPRQLSRVRHAVRVLVRRPADARLLAAAR